MNTTRFFDSHCYTFTRRPVRLVYATHFHDPNEAIRFEKQIKGWSRKKKQALIDGDWNRLHTGATRSAEASPFDSAQVVRHAHDDQVEPFDTLSMTK